MIFLLILKFFKPYINYLIIKIFFLKIYNKLFNKVNKLKNLNFYNNIIFYLNLNLVIHLNIIKIKCFYMLVNKEFHPKQNLKKN